MDADQTAARNFQARNLLGTAEILIGFAAKESPFAEATLLLETIKVVRARLKPRSPNTDPITTFAEWTLRKILSTRLTRQDFFDTPENPDWSKRHSLGGVRFDIRCRLCSEIVKSDIREPEISDADWKDICVPHLGTRHE
jgi:hypothetical protein